VPALNLSDGLEPFVLIQEILDGFEEPTAENPPRKKRSDPRYKSRINTGGNYCGHYPDSPSLELAQPAKPAQYKKGKKVRGGQLTPVQYKAIKLLNKYYANPNSLPLLNNAVGDRQHSSCGRESCIRFLKALVTGTCITNSVFGMPAKDGQNFEPFNVTRIINLSGLSRSRAGRAAQTLTNTPYYQTIKRAEKKDDGKYKGHYSVKHLTDKFFEDLGLLEELKRDREIKAEYDAKRADKKNLSKTDYNRRYQIKRIPKKKRAGIDDITPELFNDQQRHRWNDWLLASAMNEDLVGEEEKRLWARKYFDKGKCAPQIF